MLEEQKEKQEQKSSENKGIKNKNDTLSILKKIKRNSDDILINRVPKSTKKAFIKLANEEFCGDYGFLLKWLMDDILSADTKMILAKISEHEQRIANLEQMISNKDAERLSNTERMVDGSIRRVKR